MRYKMYNQHACNMHYMMRVMKLSIASYCMHVRLKSLSKQLHSKLFCQQLCQEPFPRVPHCLHHCLPGAREVTSPILALHPLFNQLQHTVPHTRFITANSIHDGRLNVEMCSKLSPFCIQVMI